MTTKKEMQWQRRAGMSLAALAGLLLAPMVAAQDECGAQAGPVVVCDPAQDYSVDGIRYIANGDLTLELDGPGAANLNLGPGISVTATGNDSIGWDSTAFIRSITGNGATLLDYHSEGGDIDIRVNGLSGTSTQGIRAVTQGGNVYLQTGVQQTSSFISRPIEIDTSAGGGDVEIDIHNTINGMDAVNIKTGTGSLRLHVHATGSVRHAGAGGAGIRIDSGGDSLITLDRGSIPGSAGSSVTAEIDLTAAAGTTTVLDSQSLLNRAASFDFSSDRVAVRGSGHGDFIIHNRGGMRANVDFSGMLDTSAAGDPSNAGRVIYYNYGRDADNPHAEAWVFTDEVSRFGSGDDIIENLPGAVIVSSTTGSFSEFSEIQTEVVKNGIDFGAGHDLFRNQGVFVVGEAIFGLNADGEYATIASDPRAFQTTLRNLEAFENSGVIVLGSWVRRAPKLSLINTDMLCGMVTGAMEEYTAPCREALGDTDAQHGTTLAMPGTHFIGAPGSTLILDARFGLGRVQANCYSNRSAPQQRLRLPGADCVDLTGGSTEGVTQVIVRDRVPGDVGAVNADGIVIVDVSNGSSAAGHFVLSPESDGFDAATGSIDKGLVMYPLIYDAERRQHKLVGLPSPRAHRAPLLLQGVQSVSRSASAQWFERRGDLRSGSGEQDAGVWVRLRSESASRDVTQSVSAHGLSIGFRNDYDQDSTVLSIGRDFRLSSAADGQWVVGGSIGYANSRLRFDSSRSGADMDGVALGAHAGYGRGAFFLDAQLLGSWLRSDYTDPYFVDLVHHEPNIVSTSFRTLDLRTELGWRLDLGEQLYLEPLAGVSWVRSDSTAATVQSDDSAGGPVASLFGGYSPASLRANLGARVGFEQPMGELHLSLVGTARVWEELRGETKVRIQSVGGNGTAIDTFDGQITEVSLGVNLANASGRISGLIQATGMFGDYESLGLTAGFRYQW